MPGSSTTVRWESNPRGEIRLNPPNRGPTDAAARMIGNTIGAELCGFRVSVTDVTDVTDVSIYRVYANTGRRGSGKRCEFKVANMATNSTNRLPGK